MQDLGFPGACQRLKLSPDGNFLFASGTHPPRVSSQAAQASQINHKVPGHQPLGYMGSSYVDVPLSAAHGGEQAT